MKFLSHFPLAPEAASSIAEEVDQMVGLEILVSFVAAIVIVVLIIGFASYFRRRHPDDIGVKLTGNTLGMEIGWTIFPTVVFLAFFVWGAKLYFRQVRPPSNATAYYVTGKQWMWKVQHQEGRREINELHIPLGEPAKLIMTSEDVIHSFFVPAFRQKMDVIPGRYTSVWFHPTKKGEFHLFCAEYCGAEHSRMIGRVIVMEPSDYQKWLQATPGETVAAQVTTPEQVFSARGCPTCHRSETAARAPKLEGLFGREVKLATGESITADESYIRESILNPTAKVVAGYQPVMPNFKGQINEDELMMLVQYVVALGQKQAAASPPSAAAAVVGAPNAMPEGSQSKGEAR